MFLGQLSLGINGVVDGEQKGWECCTTSTTSEATYRDSVIHILKAHRRNSYVQFHSQLNCRHVYNGHCDFLTLICSHHLVIIPFNSVTMYSKIAVNGLRYLSQDVTYS